MKDKMKQAGVYILVGILFVIGVYFASTSLSTIGTTDDTTGCHVVKEGDVCDQYTKCAYEPVRDYSCIKGDEIGVQVEALPDNVGTPTSPRDESSGGVEQ